MKKIMLVCATVAIVTIGCNNVNEKNAPKEYIQQVDVSTAMSMEEMNLRSAFSMGAIDLAAYRDAQQYLQKQIVEKIRFMDFSQRDMYATEESVSKSASLMKIDNLHDKNDIQEFIIYASKDERVLYTLAAYSQGDTNILTGTLITVSPKYNDNGKIKGKMNQGRQIFIPNF